MFVKQQKDKESQCNIFFVTDKIQKGEVKVAYCPTEKMLADFYTKGMAFRKMQDLKLNLPSTKN